MASATVTQGFELRGERTSLRGLLRDFWRSRDLIRILAKKDFFVRYRRASFGLLWAIGLPLFQAIVLGVIFSHIVRFKTSTPYPVFVFSGILPWSFFSAGVSMGATSIVEGTAIASKIYFPRAVLPVVTVLSGVYGFVPGIAILALMALVLGAPMGLQLLWLFPATILVVLLTTSFTLVFSATQVYFRDVKHIVAAIMMPWFWASGVFYPLSLLGNMRKWVEINPVLGSIQMFRAAVGGAAPHWEHALWWTFAWISVMLVIAAMLHRRYDRVFIDLL